MWSISGIASADVVGPPPPSCPPGSEGTANHAGPYCEPAEPCTKDADCDEAHECAPAAICVATVQTKRRDVDGTRIVAVAACTPGAACANGAACDTQKRCLPRTHKRARCACDVVGGPGGPTALVVAAAALAAVTLRKRGARAYARRP